MADAMKVGDNVVVRCNPHDGPAGEDVLGEVVEFKPGAGFAGCDLAYVKYDVAGESKVIPFGTGNLEVLSVECAEELAAVYERRAARLRRMATGLRAVKA